MLLSRIEIFDGELAHRASVKADHRVEHRFAHARVRNARELSVTPPLLVGAHEHDGRDLLGASADGASMSRVDFICKALEVAHHREDLLALLRVRQKARVRLAHMRAFGEALEVGQQGGQLLACFGALEGLLIERGDAHALPLQRQRRGGLPLAERVDLQQRGAAWQLLERQLREVKLCDPILVGHDPSQEAILGPGGAKNHRLADHRVDAARARGARGVDILAPEHRGRVTRPPEVKADRASADERDARERDHQRGVLCAVQGALEPGLLVRDRGGEATGRHRLQTRTRGAADGDAGHRADDQRVGDLSLLDALLLDPVVGLDKARILSGELHAQHTAKGILANVPHDDGLFTGGLDEALLVARHEPILDARRGGDLGASRPEKERDSAHEENRRSHRSPPPASASTLASASFDVSDTSNLPDVASSVNVTSSCESFSSSRSQSPE